MFFNTIKLSKTSWHWRLHKWMFGSIFWDDYPTNFCPYFWMTVFTILLSPIVLPIKLFIVTIIKIAKLLGKFYDFCCDGLETHVFSHMDNWLAKRIKYDDKFFVGIFELADYNDEDILAVLGATDSTRAYMKRGLYISKDMVSDLYSTKYNLRLRRWMAQTPNWREILQEELRKREHYYDHLRAKIQRDNEAKRKRENEAYIRKVKRRNTIVKWTSVIGPIVLIAAIITGFYFLTIWAITWNWKAIGGFVGFTITATLCMTVVIFIGRFLLSLLGAELLVENVYVPGFRGIGRFCEWFYDVIICGTGKGLKFIFTMFFDWKKENCPGIDWEE